jgi:signal transduction histidine kinase
MVDAALALFVMVVALAQQQSASSRSPATHSLGMTFAALFALTLTYRRRAPLAVLGVMVAALLAWSLSGVPTSGAGIPIVVALYSVAAYRPARVTLAGLALAIACVFAVRTNQGIPAADMVETVAIMAGACYFGSNVGLRRRQGESLAAYAAELAATREELANQRVAEERLRIAREMHDVVAHSLGVVAIQAGVAEHLLTQDPEQARRSVSTIGEAARTGLADMRRTLGLLRTETAAIDTEASPRVADIPKLVAELGETSQLVIELVSSGHPPPLGNPALELSVYRVVQEALTNAGKHAPRSRVAVKVAFTEQAVEVEVIDDGAGARSLDLPGSGNGLAGMRERVALFNGSFEAGPREGGGFRVWARFPLAGPGS